jgi:hypothetical protein
MNCRIHYLSMPARQMEWAGDFTMIFVPYSGSYLFKKKNEGEKGNESVPECDGYLEKIRRLSDGNLN